MNGLLKTLRIEKGWSQEQLAEIADISVRTVQRVETGEAAALETAKALAAAFDTKAERFLTPDTETSNPGSDEDRLRQVRLDRKVRLRIRFYTHLAIYTVVNSLLIAVNLSTNPGHLWFLYPLVGWGLGLAANAMKVYGPDWEGRLARKLMEKEENNTA